MGYCSKCGNEYNEGQNFCTVCGNRLDEEVFEPDKKLPLCYKIFGYVGFGLGIFTFIMAFIPIANYVTFISGPIGIVMSCLGKKEKQVYNKARKGFIFSLIGLILGVVLFIVYIVLMSLIFESYYVLLHMLYIK